MDTTLTDQMFIDKGASCSSGTLSFDYSGVQTSTPGEYDYTAYCTCDDSPCPPSQATGNVTVVAPCPTPTAPSFSVCVDTTLTDQMFIDKGASCSSGTLSFDYSGVQTSTPGEYDYTAYCTCDDSPCPPSQATGTVTVVAPCPTPTAPSFSVCVDTTLTDQMFIDKGASCSSGTLSFDYSGVQTSTPGDYDYTAYCTCDDSPCGPSQATGTVTVVAPCPTPTAPSFSVCVDTTLTDQMFIDKGASCSSGTLSFDYSGVQTSTPGDYDYTAYCTCDDSPCPPSQATGTVTVVAPCPTPTAPSFSVCVDTTLTNQMFIDKGASCSSGTLSFDYSGVQTSTPGDYDYTAYCTCDGSPCPPSQATGTVTVVAPCPTPTAPSFSVCVDTTLTNQMFIDKGASCSSGTLSFDYSGVQTSTPGEYDYTAYCTCDDSPCPPSQATGKVTVVAPCPTPTAPSFSVCVDTTLTNQMFIDKGASCSSGTLSFDYSGVQTSTPGEYDYTAYCTCDDSPCPPSQATGKVTVVAPCPTPTAPSFSVCVDTTLTDQMFIDKGASCSSGTLSFDYSGVQTSTPGEYDYTAYCTCDDSPCPPSQATGKVTVVAPCPTPTAPSFSVCVDTTLTNQMFIDKGASCSSGTLSFDYSGVQTSTPGEYDYTAYCTCDDSPCPPSQATGKVTVVAPCPTPTAPSFSVCVDTTLTDQMFIDKGASCSSGTLSFDYSGVQTSTPGEYDYTAYCTCDDSPCPPSQATGKVTVVAPCPTPTAPSFSVCVDTTLTDQMFIDKGASCSSGTLSFDYSGVQTSTPGEYDYTAYCTCDDSPCPPSQATGKVTVVAPCPTPTAPSFSVCVDTTLTNQMFIDKGASCSSGTLSFDYSGVQTSTPGEYDYTAYCTCDDSPCPPSQATGKVTVVAPCPTPTAPSFSVCVDTTLTDQMFIDKGASCSSGTLSFDYSGVQTSTPGEYDYTAYCTCDGSPCPPSQATGKVTVVAPCPTPTAPSFSVCVDTTLTDQMFIDKGASCSSGTLSFDYSGVQTSTPGEYDYTAYCTCDDSPCPPSQATGKVTVVAPCPTPTAPSFSVCVDTTLTNQMFIDKGASCSSGTLSFDYSGVQTSTPGEYDYTAYCTCDDSPCPPSQATGKVTVVAPCPTPTAPSFSVCVDTTLTNQMFIDKGASCSSGTLSFDYSGVQTSTPGEYDYTAYCTCDDSPCPPSQATGKVTVVAPCPTPTAPSFSVCVDTTLTNQMFIDKGASCSSGTLSFDYSGVQTSTPGEYDYTAYCTCDDSPCPPSQATGKVTVVAPCPTPTAPSFSVCVDTTLTNQMFIDKGASCSSGTLSFDYSGVQTSTPGEYDYTAYCTCDDSPCPPSQATGKVTVVAPCPTPTAPSFSVCVDTTLTNQMFIDKGASCSSGTLSFDYSGVQTSTPGEYDYTAYCTCDDSPCPPSQATGKVTVVAPCPTPTAPSFSVCVDTTLTNQMFIDKGASCSSGTLSFDYSGVQTSTPGEYDYTAYCTCDDSPCPPSQATGKVTVVAPCPTPTAPSFSVCVDTTLTNQMFIDKGASCSSGTLSFDYSGVQTSTPGEYDYTAYCTCDDSPCPPSQATGKVTVVAPCPTPTAPSFSVCVDTTLTDQMFIDKGASCSSGTLSFDYSGVQTSTPGEYDYTAYCTCDDSPCPPSQATGKVTVVAPCPTPTAPSFSVCVDTTLTDQMFIDKGASCSSGTLSFDYSGVQTSTPGEYDYTAYCTCDDSPCPPSQATGKVTVVAPCPTPTAPSFSVCVDTTLTNQMFIDKGASCSSGTLSFDYSGVQTSTPGEYDYTAYCTCDDSPCPPSQATGKVTVVAPCPTPTAPSFSVCVDTTLTDQMFIDKGASCSSGTLSFDYSGVQTSTPGEYDYTAYCTCDDSPCPPSQATGKVTVVAPCPTPTAPSFSVCVDTTLTESDVHRQGRLLLKRHPLLRLLRRPDLDAR